jgi:serine/threonine-protein kinase
MAYFGEARRSPPRENHVLTGQRLGRYEVLAKLGEGGMGEVYLAEDTTLNRKVAIKFIRQDASGSDEANRRLLREARAAAMLDHPNICAIHEVGEESGRSFIVMQYIEGETLDRRIRQQPLSLDQALGTAVEIIDAISEAHARGIVHRDIKPSNVIVTPRGQVKVMDFGLASVAPDKEPVEGETQSALTTPHALVGTVPYMSPEQVAGDRVDARSDLFSFGITLYEMVSGRRPFAGSSSAATASAILTAQPEPLTRYRNDLPEELQRIVRKCLEKDRDRRYQSAADLKVDLENLRRDMQSGPRSTAGMGGVVERPSPRRGAAVMVAIVGLALVAGAWFGWRRFTQPSASANAIGSIAVFPFANSSGDQNTEYLSDGITESLINNFSKLPQLRVIARTTMFRYKGRDVDPLEAGSALGVDAALTGRVLEQGDTLVVQADLVRVADGSQLWGDRFDRKRTDVLAIQDEMARQIADRLRLRLTGEEQALITKRYTGNSEAYDLYLKGRYFYGKATEDDLTRSLDYFQQAIAIDPRYALAYVGLADTYSRLGSVLGFRSPRETLPRSQELVAKALSLDPTLPDAQATRAHYLLTYEWQWEEAEREIKRLLALNPNNALLHQHYGGLLNVLGRLDEAIVERRIAQRLDPLSPFATANVGYPYYYARRYDEAIQNFRLALELDANFPWSHLWLGQAYLQKGMHREALDEIQQAIRLSGGDTRAIATLGHAYAVIGRRDDALKVLGELQAIATKRYVSPYFMGLIHLGLQDDDRAFASLEAAFQERHPYLALLKVEPVFDRVRSDKRFVALEKRVGLTP